MQRPIDRGAEGEPGRARGSRRKEAARSWRRAPRSCSSSTTKARCWVRAVARARRLSVSRWEARSRRSSSGPSRGAHERVPLELDGRREALVYLREPGDLAAYEELRAGFTAAVSHELRTPLARLLALLETALLPSADATELIEQAKAEVEQIRELIDDVLFLSELETGRAVVSLASTRGCADRPRGARRRSPSSAVRAGVTLELELDEDARGPAAAADAPGRAREPRRERDPVRGRRGGLLDHSRAARPARPCSSRQTTGWVRATEDLAAPLRALLPRRPRAGLTRHRARARDREAHRHERRRQRRGRGLAGARAEDPDRLPGMSAASPEAGAQEVVFDIKDLTVRYNGSPAISDISFQVFSKQITAIIGPSGCGKSTFLRCLNRMNDLIPGARSRARSSTTATTSTARTSTRSRCGGGSGWSSRSRTRSRSRSTTTSRTARASLGMKRRPRRARRAGAASRPRSGTRSRTG